MGREGGLGEIFLHNCSNRVAAHPESSPDSLRDFMATVCNMAIDIANALLEDGYNKESRMISIATAHAKEWGKNHNKQIHKKRKLPL